MKRMSCSHVGTALIAGACLIIPVTANAQSTMARQHHAMNGMSSKAAGTLSSADRHFMMTAAEINHGEVQSGTMAEQRGAVPAVRDIGKRYVSDHTANQKKLATLAMKTGVALPPQMQVTPDDKMAAMRLQALHGAAFDSAWLHAEQKGHESAIQAYKTEMNDGSDSAVVSYAKKSLPVLEEHLDLATDAATHMHSKMSSR